MAHLPPSLRIALARARGVTGQGPAAPPPPSPKPLPVSASRPVPPPPRVTDVTVSARPKPQPEVPKPAKAKAGKTKKVAAPTPAPRVADVTTTVTVDDQEQAALILPPGAGDLRFDAPGVLAATKGRRPTDEQMRIMEAAVALRPVAGQALRVRAYAGSGKTSTLKCVAAVIGGDKQGMYLAFNSAIAKEAAGDFPRSVTAKTMHSLAYHAVGVTQANLAKSLNGHYVREVLPNGWTSKARVGVLELGQARLVAQVLRFFFASADAQPTQRHVDAVLDLHVYRVPLDAPTDREARRRHSDLMKLREDLAPLLLRQARGYWEKVWGEDEDGAGWSKAGMVIPHDCYLKIFERQSDLIQRAFAGTDYLMIDEAQDLNPVQRSIAVQSGLPLVCVGDSFQQVYSWRGAEDALDLLPGPETYLSASFRFGSQIAAFAQRILVSRPGGGLPVPLRGLGPQGVVTTEGSARVLLCRTNAAVLRSAGSAALAGTKVHVVGGISELAEELESAVALSEKRLHDVKADSLKRFSCWEELKEEAEALDDANLKRLVEAVEDKKGTARMLAALKQHHVPSEEGAELVVSTTHRAKGREWDAVELCDDFPGPVRAWKRYDAARAKRRADLMKQAVEEWHVFYVAATRARKRLIVPERLMEDMDQWERQQRPQRDSVFDREEW